MNAETLSAPPRVASAARPVLGEVFGYPPSAARRKRSSSTSAPAATRSS
jgi:hypothetical protein